LAYIFVAACMGLSSFKFVQWALKDASFLHQSAFWPFNVVQGHPRFQCRWFWYQSKAHIRLPISRSLWLWSYLAPFLRYGDLLAKNFLFFLHFPYPSLIRRPRSLCSLESWGSSEDRMIAAGVVLAWYQRVTDRPSDRIYHSKDNALHSKVCWRAVNKTAELSQRRPRDAPNIWVHWKV